MFNNGAKIVKVDFHMHTNSDKEFSYNGDPDYYISNYISKMNTENIGVGVITNHNKFVKDEYIKLKKTAKKKDVLILPGVELSIKEGANGVHTLIIFDPEQWLSNDTNKIAVGILIFDAAITMIQKMKILVASMTFLGCLKN